MNKIDFIEKIVEINENALIDIIIILQANFPFLSTQIQKVKNNADNKIQKLLKEGYI